MTNYPIALILAGLLILAGCGGQKQPGPPPDKAELQHCPFGGDFALTDYRGAPFRLQDQRGKIALLFFGYTSCPDACPTTLIRLTQAIQLLGEARTDLLVAFVTVDPARDTPKALGEYLANFSLPALGLSGSDAEIHQVATRYGATYKRGADTAEGGYLMDHTDRVFLIDQQGALRYLFSRDDTPARIAELIRKLR
ncbi:MAG: SCO family protein [Candidatus Latescibacteria bacterium]|nr:SCO family protein [Candidatus Latescibacterota bacterium]